MYNQLSKKQQSGFTLLISFVIMIILTLLGLGFASRGKLSSQITQSTTRYEAVSAAAEDEMLRLIRLLNNTQNYIATGNGVVIDDAATPARITQVWNSQALATVFGNARQPSFTDFTNAGWSDDAAITNTVTSDYGAIKTQGFVQELVKKTSPNSGEVTAQYLITVKAFSQNPDETDTANEREAVAYQSLTSLRFFQ